MAGIWRKSVRNHGANFSRFCGDTLGQERALYTRIWRAPWVLVPPFIDNAPHDAKCPHFNKHPCHRPGPENVFPKWLSNNWRVSLLTGFTLCQCLLMRTWTALSKFIFYYLPRWIVHSGWSGVFTVFHVHSCFHTSALAIVLLIGTILSTTVEPEMWKVRKETAPQSTLSSLPDQSQWEWHTRVRVGAEGGLVHLQTAL